MVLGVGIAQCLMAEIVLTLSSLRILDVLTVAARAF